MALIAVVTPQEGYKYIPQSQKGEENPFTLWVKPLTSKQLMVLEDKVVRRSGDSEVTLSAGQFSFSTCGLSILNWGGIEDSLGNPLTIKKNADGTITDESLCYIPTEIITEVANVVSAISRDKANVQIFFPEEEEIKPKVKAKVNTKE